MKKIIIGCLFVVGLHSYSYAQSLEESLTKLSSTVGKAFVAPVISGFGSNLNSGWVNNVPTATKLGFTIDIKIIGMASFFNDDEKTFSASSGFVFDDDQVRLILENSNITPATIGQIQYNSLEAELRKTEFIVSFSGPTAVGSKNEHLKVNFPGKTIIAGGQPYTVNPYEVIIEEVKGFLGDLFGLPTAAVQLTLGTVAGTNIAIRYFPSVDIEDMGKFNFWGFGAIHNPGVWMNNPLPLDIGIGYFYQKMTVGDVFTSTANQFGIYAGKKIGGIFAISPYAGITFETAKTTVKYEYQSNETINGVPVKPVNIGFDVEGKNSISFIVGLTIKLAALNLNADYKLAQTKTASIGISLGF